MPVVYNEIPPKRDCSFEAVTILSNPHVFPFCANLTTLKSTFIFSLFPDSSHVDIAFLVKPQFLASFDGFFDSITVIALYFSKSDDLFLFKITIFNNIQL